MSQTPLPQMKRIALIFYCLCTLLPDTAHATEVPRLYQAETLVSSQSDEDRIAAVRACLGKVLVKLTGVREVARNTALQPLLQAAETFVQQYRYHDAATAGPEGVPVPSWRFTVKFDEQNLNRSLRAAGLPVWDRERPSVLVWLVLEQAGRRGFVEAGQAPELLRIIQQLAQRRGIPMLLPLLDLDEQRQIRPGDVWLDFREPIMAASARYNADVILTASVSAVAPGIWEGHWRSYGESRPEHEWTTQTELPETALEEGFNGFADTLAGEFLRSSSYIPVGDIEITVGAIDTIEQYARLLAYLDSLHSVGHIHVKEVRRGEVTLALTAHGGAQTILQTLSLGRTLEPVADTDGHYYRLARLRQ